MLERVLSATADTLVGEGRIAPGTPLAAGGRAPAFTALELAAQAAGVLFASRGSGAVAGAPRPGFVVALRRVVFHAAELDVGEPLQARVTLVAASPPLHTFDAVVTAGGRELLSATIGMYLE